MKVRAYLEKTMKKNVATIHGAGNSSTRSYGQVTTSQNE